MPTRRSSRDRSATSATPSEHIAEPVVVPSLSRRAARERLLAERLLAERAKTVAAQSEAGDSSQSTPVSEANDSSQATTATEADEPTQSAPTEASTASEGDAFIRASRAFAGVPAVPLAPTAVVAQAFASASASVETSHLVQRRPRSAFARKTLAVCGSLGVMAVAGLMALSVTLPAEAVAAVQGIAPISSLSEVTTSLVAEDDTAVQEGEIQAFVASDDVQTDVVERVEDYSTASIADLAAERGIVFSSSLYTNDANAAIQWPFVVGVGMSSGFGQRWGRMHEGIDLVPGAGAPIQSIAEGTVRIATESGGAYGVTVYIDHIVDGQVVTSHYSHMQYGSLRVSAGDKVEVGDIIGLVGNTGRSYGAHLHFEIIVNGTKIDPLPWLQENAGRYSH